MASVTEVREMRATGGGPDSLTRYFQVFTDGYMEIYEILLDTVNIPQKGEQLGTTRFKVEDVTVDLIEGEETAYNMTVVYSTRSQGGVPDLGSNERLLSFRLDSVEYQVVAKFGTFYGIKIIYRDGSEKDALKSDSPYWDQAASIFRIGEKAPVVNSAANIFDSPPMTEVTNQLIQFSQLERSSFDPEAAQEQQGSINKEDITVCGIDIPKGKGMLKKVSSELQSNGDWIGAYRIEKSTGKEFTLDLLDRGYNKLNTPPDETTRVRLKYSDVNPGVYGTGQAREEDDGPIDDPHKLDGFGSVLFSEDVSDTAAVYLRWRVPELSDWNNVLDLVKRRR